MSVTLAKGERIIRSYDYGKVKKIAALEATEGCNNLTITNRRIIHSRSAKGMGKSGLSVQEIPVRSAKYVNVSYGVIKYPMFLLLAICYMLCALTWVIVFADYRGDRAFIGGVMFAVVAVICLVIYLVKKDCKLNCAITTDGIVSPVMALSTSSGNSMTRKMYKKAAVAASATTFNVAVKVNMDVAKQMAEELGAVIMAAANEENVD